jgi:hypothetical protein
MVDPRDHLCWYDPRSTNYVEPDGGDLRVVRPAGCGCDPCFSGRDKLACEIIILRELFAELGPLVTRFGELLEKKR